MSFQRISIILVICLQVEPLVSFSLFLFTLSLHALLLEAKNLAVCSRQRIIGSCFMPPGDGSGAADLMNSLAPLLQHLAGALQQSGDPAPVQPQVLFLPL